MSAEHPKKLLILYILDILQKYSDEELRLLIDSLLFSKHIPLVTVEGE